MTGDVADSWATSWPLLVSANGLFYDEDAIGRGQQVPPDVDGAGPGVLGEDRSYARLGTRLRFSDDS